MKLELGFKIHEAVLLRLHRQADRAAFWLLVFGVGGVGYCMLAPVWPSLNWVAGGNFLAAFAAWRWLARVHRQIDQLEGR